MGNRITYAIGNPHVMLVDNTFYESHSPFWVYWNNKLAAKFCTMDDAKMYIRVLLRYDIED
tara:strand:- start:3098 stop:3280 length:183 start_codon:yes stop_codon:yes gene_type:complete